MNISLVHEAALSLWSALPPLQALYRAALAKQQEEKEAYQTASEAYDETAEGAVAPEEPDYTPLPSDDDKKAVRCSREDVVAGLANLHRASYWNALPADSVTAAEAEADSMMVGPDAESVSYRSFQRYVAHLITKKWADPRCLNFTPVRPGTSSNAASSSRPGTSLDKAATGGNKAIRCVFDEYLYDLVRCVVDDREPCGLLPLADVWNRAIFPLTVEKPFAQFARLEPHREYPLIYDELWDAAVVPPADTATKGQFGSVVRLAVHRYFTNATDERAAALTEWLWYEAVCVTGFMSRVEFRKACRTIIAAFTPKSPHNQATRQSEEATASSLQALVEAAKAASCEGAQWLHATVVNAPHATLLNDPAELFLHDELEVSVAEEEVFRSSTSNRILVTGESGVGKTSLAKEMAAELNCVFLDAEELAIAAADTPFDNLGSQVRQLVSQAQPVPLYLQAELIRRCLAKPSTQHRGYVCGDIPPINPKTAAAFLNELGIEKYLPQAIVRIDCPSTLLEGRRQAAADRDDELYDDELAARAAEQGELDARAQAALEKKNRAARNAALAAKKEMLENKASDLTDEEQAIMDQPEEEEPEEEPQFDEEGNQLDPDEVAERNSAKLRASQRRRFLTELHKQIVEGRRCLVASGQGTDLTDAPILNTTREICEARHRIVHVSCAEDPKKLSRTLVGQLGLVRSCVPAPVPLPDESKEELPAGDTAAYGEAVTQIIEETPSRFPLSKWGKSCPVTYAEDGILFEGLPDFSVVYRNRLYFLAGTRRLTAFVDDPNKYLRLDPTVRKSVMLLKNRVDTFASAATSVSLEAPVPFTNAVPSHVEAHLAHRLRLTPTTLQELVGQWKAQEHEFTIRQVAAKERVKADLKRRKEADDRLAKRLEAEAKRRKKEEKNKKKPKKGAAEAPKVEEAEDDADLYAEPEEVVETTDMRLEKEIEGKKRAQVFTFAPQLISLLDTPLSAEDLSFLFDIRALPETVIVLKQKVPRAVVVDSTEEEEAPDEDADADSVDDEEEEEAEELDEEGEVIPKPPKVVDLADPKQYKKFMQTFLQKLAAAAETAEEEKGAALEEPLEGEDAPPRPSQPFAIKTFNIFNRPSSEHLVDDILYHVKPCVLRAAPLPEGEEVIAEDEPIEELEGLEAGGQDGNPTNPLIVPGRRARHQYGRTSHYCPVTLAEHGVLVKGDLAICAVYDHSKYVFVNQQQMDAFLMNPLRYIPSGLPVAVPPPRLWVLGPKAAGKRTVVERLSSKYKIPAFASTDLAYIDELLAAAVSPSGGEVKGVYVPPQDQTTSYYLNRAVTLRKSLVDFDDEQAKKAKRKADAEASQEERERLIQEGEDVDELDEEEEAELEEALGFEPEEEEVGSERRDLAMRRICAALTRIEPFASAGYILAGHPSSEAELQVFLDNRAYPDVVIHLKETPEEFVKRRIDAEVAAKEAEFVAKTSEIEQLRRREAERARATELRKWRRRNIGGEDEEPEEEELEIPEDPEPVSRDNIQADLEAEFEESSAAVASVVELLPEKRIQFIDVNGDGGLETVFAHTCNVLAPYVEARRSLMEAAQVVPYHEAVKALEGGACMISSFNHADPVALYDRRALGEKAVDRYTLCKGRSPAEDVEEEIPEVEASLPTKPNMKTIIETNEDGDEEEIEVPEEEEEAAMEEEAEEPEELEPEPELTPEELEELQAELNEKKRIEREKAARKTAFFRNRVYYFDSDSNLLKFVQSPVTYWDQAPPLPHVPPIVAVSEMPLAAKDSNSKRLMGHHVAVSIGATFIDLPKLLKWSLLHRDALPGVVDEDLVAALLHNAPIDPTKIQTALTTRLGCADVLTNGAVVCNLLKDASDAEAQLHNGIKFTAALCFADEGDAEVHNAAIDTIEAHSRIAFAVESPRWSTKALVDAVQHVKHTKEAAQRLISRRQLGYPLRAHLAGIPEKTLFASTTQEFGMYCPYTWANNGELISMDNDRRFTAEFLGRVYCFSAESYLAEFLEHPEVYAGTASTATLPSILPNRKSAEEAASQTVELFGCCPVTLYDTRKQLGLKGVAEPKAVKGELFVEYGGKHYAIFDEPAMERFLRQPWIFVDNAVLPLPHKLPMEPEVIRAKSPSEYITRTMYDGVAKALISVAEVRPKFPGLSAEETVRKYISLHLKAFNPDNTATAAQQYKANFEEFKQIATLYNTVGNTPPSDTNGLERFNSACELWDAVQSNPNIYEKFQYLRETHADPEPSASSGSD